MAIRVAVLVDGFNLYHSIQDSIAEGAPKRIKWLDLKGLISSNFLYALGPDSAIESIDYFSSLQSWRKEQLSRHRAYIRALEAQGVKVHYGQFKDKPVTCKAQNGCGKDFLVKIEKRTDVAIAARILEIFVLEQADTILLLSGDTDLVPAIETAKRLFPVKKISVAFPYNRHNYELQGVAKPVFKMTIDHYKKHCLPDTVDCGNGKRVTIPADWK